MPSTHTVILTSGGLRSLVAIGSALSGGSRLSVTLLHLLDGRSNTKIRAQYVRRQAEHFKVHEVVTVDLPRVTIKQDDQTPNTPRPLSPLLRTQVLINGLMRAIQIGADRLIWPTQSNGDFAHASLATEQAVLARHMVKTEHPSPPTIQTPLLELTDPQLLALGDQLGLPWELGWSCLMHGEKHCRVCDGCRRRIAAFEAAGKLDPSIEPAPTR